MNEDKPIRVMRWLRDVLENEPLEMLDAAITQACTCINQSPPLSDDAVPISIIEFEASLRAGDTWIAAERTDTGAYVGIGVHRKAGGDGSWEIWIPTGVEGEERAMIQRSLIRLLNMEQRIVRQPS